MPMFYLVTLKGNNINRVKHFSLKTLANEYNTMAPATVASTFQKSFFELANSVKMNVLIKFYAITDVDFKTMKIRYL